MARIQAGSTLVNQYAPPFVVSDSVTQGWELIWSDTLQAFEAVDPSANTVNAGFDEINVQLYENVTQQTFVAPFATDSKQSVIITIDGVKQQQDAYSWSSDTASNTTTITLADTVSSETVEILGLQTVGGATVELYGPQPIDSNVAGTVNAYFDLNWFAPSAESLIVTVDGVKQATNNYNIAPVPGSNFTATRLTFPDRTITFNTSTGVDAANEIITTDTAHGFTTGDGIYYGNDGGAATPGLTNGTLYYVAVLSAFTLAIHTTRNNAINDAGNGDPNRVDLTAGGAETHALTLIADPYLYINDSTDSLNAGGTGYSESDVLTVQGGSPVIEAQIRVDAVDLEATFTFDTDGAGTVTAITIVNGGTGYPASGGGTFNLTVASDSGYTPGTQALITYTTDGAGVIDTAVVTNAGSGYTINLSGQTVSPVDIPNPTLGAITAYSFLHLGEYVAFPSSPVSVLGGTGTGASFNVVAVSPQLEVIGITTTGETPASPVNATNIGSPDDATRFGIYDSKTVSGETQVLNFKSLAEGTGITMTAVGDTLQINASSDFTGFGQVGSGTSLFDNNDETANPAVFRRITGGDNISITVDASGDPADTLVVKQNFNYLSSADATITLTTERLVNVLPAGATTVNLPAASTVTAGDVVVIKDANGTSGTNNIAVTPDGTDLIDGLNSAVTLAENGAQITLYSDGSNWHTTIVGSNTGDNAPNSLYSGLVSNATHTGQVTGATALALDVTAITAQPASGALTGTDTILANDGGVLSEATMTQVSTFVESNIVGTQEVWIPAHLMYEDDTVVNNAAQEGKHPQPAPGAFGRLVLDTWDFDDTIEEGVQFTSVFPKRWNTGTINIEVYWTSESGSADDVLWWMYAIARTDGDVFGAGIGGFAFSFDTHNGTANTLNVTTITNLTIGETPADGDMCFFRLVRAATDIGDTLTGDAKLVGVKLIWTSDAVNDA